MDKSEIESIINSTLDVRRKKMARKIFQDPDKAETICIIFGVITFFTVAILAMFYLTGSNDSFFIDSLLDTMNCKSLKDLHTSFDLTYSQKQNVIQHMLIQCL